MIIKHIFNSYIILPFFSFHSPPSKAPFGLSPALGATGGPGVTHASNHPHHHHPLAGGGGEAMDTAEASPSGHSPSNVRRSPAIATKNSEHKGQAFPGTHNRPPHLQMNM